MSGPESIFVLFKLNERESIAFFGQGQILDGSKVAEELLEFVLIGVGTQVADEHFGLEDPKFTEGGGHSGGSPWEPYAWFFSPESRGSSGN